MSIKFSILLYSKYSLQLIELIKNSNIDFVNNFNFKLLCVDSEKIRKRITQKNDFDIKVVPCILIAYNDGRLEKYEDLKAFEWVEQIILQFYPPMPPPPPQQVQQTIDENIIEQPTIEQEQHQHQPRKTKQKQKQTNSPIKKQKSSSNSNSTPIDEIETDNEYQDDENLDDLNEMDNIDEFNKKSEPPNALNAKKNNLMSLATSMQKSRDSFVEKTEKPKGKFGGIR